jgi:hypothetical protein
MLHNKTIAELLSDPALYADDKPAPQWRDKVLEQHILPAEITVVRASWIKPMVIAVPLVACLLIAVSFYFKIDFSFGMEYTTVLSVALAIVVSILTMSILCHSKQCPYSLSNI